MEEAKIQHSGLTLFDSKGHRVLEEDEDEGEIETPRHKYDIQKLHDFPGFNSDPGQVSEPTWARSFPRMSPFSSKEELIKTLTENGNIVDGYKRKKLRNLEEVENENNSNEVNDVTTIADVEMEIEDVDEVGPLGVTVIDLANSPEPQRVCQDLEDYCSSPTLEELENRKKKLLADLAESSSFLDSSAISCSLECSTTTIEIADDSNSCSIIETSNNSTMHETIIENCENENTENSQIERQPPQPSPRSPSPIPPPPPPKSIQDTVLGAPVLPSFSGHSTLPSGEKFSKGVCDVIAFENLPDSTGKYEQMRTLLAKVRKQVDKIQHE